MTQMNLSMKQKQGPFVVQRDSDMEEGWISRCKLVYIEWWTIRSYVNHNGKEYEKNVYTYNWVTLQQ